MTEQELKSFILSKSCPECAKQPGMVYQVWEDGEITLQKSGELLWQRTLHQMEGPLPFDSKLSNDVMPETYANHSFVFVSSKEDATLIREQIRQFFSLSLK